MEKSTVLARMRFSMSFSEETQHWFRSVGDYDLWFAREGGDPFFREFSGSWRELFRETVSPEIENYFRSLEIPREHMPRVDFGEEYSGSWIVDAAITMAGPVGTAYAILKGVSELPKIVEGLANVGGKIAEKLGPAFNRAVGKTLREMFDTSLTQLNIGRPQLPGPTFGKPPFPPPPPPPANPVRVNLTIDARPLIALTPAALKSHALHMSVAVSRDSFVVENLGLDAMNDIRIGIFRTPQERHQWSYEDSFAGTIPLLSTGQTVTKRMGEFHSRGSVLDFSDGDAAHVDCWIEDNYGIYLFRFFLEKE